MLLDRRRFLTHGIFGLAVTTAGSITLDGCGSSGSGEPVGATSTAGDASAAPVAAAGPGWASFQWALSTPANGSVYAYFELTRDLTIRSLEINASIAPSMTAADIPGFAQANCRGWVSRGSSPSFAGAGADGSAAPTPPSANFGPVMLYNPDQIGVEYDPAVNSDVFYSAVLRNSVSSEGLDVGGTHRLAELAMLALEAGDYLVFEIRQNGIPSAVDMQAVLNYI